MKRTSVIFFLMLSFVCRAQETAVTLEQCLSLASHNDYALRSARLDVSSASLQQREARWEYLPKVGVTAAAYYAFNPLLTISLSDVLGSSDDARELSGTISDAAYERGIKPYYSGFHSGYGVSLTALQPVYAGGRIRAGNRLASLGVESAGIFGRMAEKASRDSVENKYWKIVSLQEKASAIDEALRLLDSLEKDASGAFGAGLVSDDALSELHLKQGELEALRRRLEGGMSLMKMDLFSDIGLPFRRLDLPGMRLTDTLAVLTPPTEIVGEDSENAPSDESRLLELKVEAERLRGKMETGEFLPQLAVGAGYGYGAFSDPAKGSFNGMVFATLQIPITDIGKGALRSRRLENSVQKAMLEQERLEAKLHIRTQMLILGMETAWDDYQSASREVAAAEDSLRKAKSLYEAGMAASRELVQAQLSLVQAKEKLTDSRIAYRLAVNAYTLR